MWKKKKQNLITPTGRQGSEEAWIIRVSCSSGRKMVVFITHGMQIGRDGEDSGAESKKHDHSSMGQHENEGSLPF